MEFLKRTLILRDLDLLTLDTIKVSFLSNSQQCADIILALDTFHKLPTYVYFACSGLLLGVQALEEKLDAPGISRQQQSVLILWTKWATRLERRKP